MMKLCRNIPLMISRSLDNDLRTGEKAALEAHLAVCGKCRMKAKSYAVQRELIAASFSDKPLPVEAFAALLARNGRKRHAPPRRFLRLGLAGTGCAFAAMIVVVWFLTHPGGPAAAAPSILLESAYPSTMTMPMSSMVYYEEYAGKAVHSQFVKILPQRSSPTLRERIIASYYDSPLFDESLTVAANGEATNEQ